MNEVQHSQKINAENTLTLTIVWYALDELSFNLFGPMNFCCLLRYAI